uniref:Uncharacterized protein n=1 Tax=Arundo donax TaxID=35708 RepID=A0A0A9ARJ1_ARUDO
MISSWMLGGTSPPPFSEPSPFDSPPASRPFLYFMAPPHS